MKRSITVLMLVGIIATVMIASSLMPVADAKIKRGCNENTNTQTGNPHGDQNPTGNPHGGHHFFSTGNPHSACVTDPGDGDEEEEESPGDGGNDGKTEDEGSN